MPYTFDPSMMYRMPTHFGPAMGPRQGPDGRKFHCVDNPKTTSVSVTFRTDPDQLAEFLPPGFELGDEPLVTVQASYMKEIEWLAGRGYNTLGVTFPAVFRGERATVRGPLLTVLWENLTDPIITGREELGFSKIYCELPEPRITGDSVGCAAGWLGFQFMDMTVRNLERQENTPAAAAGKVDGTLHFKYMPRTGEWGTPDACYAVMTPAETPNRRVLEQWSGDGVVEWRRAEWEDLPTMYPIVNAFAGLEVREYVAGGMVKSVGGKDLSDQTILR